MLIRQKKFSVLPGFGLTLGYTVLYLSLLVLFPLAALFAKAAGLSWVKFWATVTHPQVMASYRLTFGAALVAASVNVVFGFVVAWTLVRYRFPGKRLVDAMVDLPFALPTAVSGIALAVIYADDGWIGRYLKPLGIEVVSTPLGVMVAMTFIGLPFVVRTLEPALADLERETEEAAASLGANRWQTLTRVIVPTVLPALLTGFALALARAIGEYGSVIFIAGNKEYYTEITTLLIYTKLDQHHVDEATAIAVAMLAVSFLILLAINTIQWWSGRRYRGVA
jgi:sulfate transport system permease protein